MKPCRIVSHPEHPAEYAIVTSRDNYVFAAAAIRWHILRFASVKQAESFAEQQDWTVERPAPEPRASLREDLVECLRAEAAEWRHASLSGVGNIASAFDDLADRLEKSPSAR